MGNGIIDSACVYVFFFYFDVFISQLWEVSPFERHYSSPAALLRSLLFSRKGLASLVFLSLVVAVSMFPGIPALKFTEAGVEIVELRPGKQ